MAKRFVMVESTETGKQTLMTARQFRKTFGGPESKEILAGYWGNIVAFRTEGCSCGEGHDLHLGHCEGCALRKYQTKDGRLMASGPLSDWQ
jgi:hypothetical protein